MAYFKSNPKHRPLQGHTSGLSEIKAILDSIDASPIVDVLWKYRWNGRPGYPLESLWRAHLARYLLNLSSINALIRRLQDDRTLRMICGISEMPHRCTFNRFFTRLANHQDLVDQVVAGLTDEIRALLPDFGQKVAADSTNVRTYASPNRPLTADPEASWTGKTRKDGKGTEWHFGYKLHALVDATHGLPITSFTTTASHHDSPELPRLLSKANHIHGWFSPRYVICDKGYDAVSNYSAVLKIGAAPIIAIKRHYKGRLREGVYGDDGTPTCVGMLPMEFVRTDPDKGHLYRCPPNGCHLKNRPGMAYCLDEVWENREDNPRLFGLVRRASPEWKALYLLRQSVERVFKSLKQSRSLGTHGFRGLKKVSLHATLSLLTLQATALHRLRAGQAKHVRWQVTQVA